MLAHLKMLLSCHLILSVRYLFATPVLHFLSRLQYSSISRVRLNDKVFGTDLPYMVKSKFA